MCKTAIMKYRHISTSANNWKREQTSSSNKMDDDRFFLITKKQISIPVNRLKRRGGFPALLKVYRSQISSKDNQEEFKWLP